jgi:hypothetical protein
MYSSHDTAERLQKMHSGRRRSCNGGRQHDQGRKCEFLFQSGVVDLSRCGIVRLDFAVNLSYADSALPHASFAGSPFKIFF